MANFASRSFLYSIPLFYLYFKPIPPLFQISTLSTCCVFKSNLSFGLVLWGLRYLVSADLICSHLTRSLGSHIDRVTFSQSLPLLSKSYSVRENTGVATSFFSFSFFLLGNGDEPFCRPVMICEYDRNFLWTSKGLSCSYLFICLCVFPF